MRGELPSYRVYEDDNLLVILDKFPATKGHLLVITKSHHPSVEETPTQLLKKAWLAASALASVYRKKLGAPGANILTNSGKAAGQIIPHFHIHVIPRWGEGEVTWKPKGELTEQEAQEVLELLKPHARGQIEQYLREA